jgi:hypothetical protein
MQNSTQKTTIPNLTFNKANVLDVLKHEDFENFIIQHKEIGDSDVLVNKDEVIEALIKESILSKIPCDSNDEGIMDYVIEYRGQNFDYFNEAVHHINDADIFDLINSGVVNYSIR